MKEEAIGMPDWDQQEQRIHAVLGHKKIRPSEALKRWYRHLVSHLVLPCDVKGIEDFRWEEFYVFGPGSAAEYRSLRKSRPSYQDVFELTAIEIDAASEWSMFPEELKACVRRESDDKQFILGLSELETTSEHSSNFQLLDDYAVWFVNDR